MLTDMPHIIVTGGCGFIGSHVTQRLLDTGFSVSVIDDNRTGNYFIEHDNVEYYQKDVATFNPHQAFIEPPIAIIHLANSPRIRRALEYPTETIVNNISTTAAVADWARIFNCKLFFSSSSSTQYDESIENPYTLSKLQCHQILGLYRKLYQLDFVLMFFYNVYGPGEANYGEYSTVIRKFKMDYLEGKPLTIFGTGKKERDFTHVDDVVQGLLQLLADEATPAVAHFGSGDPKTIQSIADSFGAPVVHSFNRPGEAEKTFCSQPYILPTHDVHEYIKDWIKRNHNDIKKNN